MGRKPKFYETETDPNNAELRIRVKELNNLIKRLNKSDKDREILKELLQEYKEAAETKKEK